MSNIISYVDIIEVMTSIAQRHYQVNSFFLGKDYELENNDDLVYPVFQVYPEFARMPINDYKQYKTLEVTLNCKVIDLTTNDDGNLKDVHSDTLRIAQDIVNELNAHPFYVRSNVSLMEDIAFTALEHFDDDITAGWQFALKLKVINANTFCGMPIEELPGYSANGPTSSGNYVTVDWRGPTGPQGATGTAGIDGATGPEGPQGASGSSGTFSQTLQEVINTNGTINGLLAQSPDTSTYIYLGDDYIDMSSYDEKFTSGFNMYTSTGNNLYSDVKNIFDAPIHQFNNTLRLLGFSSYLDLTYDDNPESLLSIANGSDYGGIVTGDQKVILNYNTGLVEIYSNATNKLIVSRDTNEINLITPNVKINSSNINTLAYYDSNKYLKSVALGSGLTFSGGTLSTTATIPVISTTTVISTATSSIIDVSTPNTYHSVTSLSSGITFTTSGTHSNFNKLLVRIKDNGTARTLTFDPTYFEAKGQALPTTTVISKVITVGFIYDSVTSKYGCVSVAQEI